MNKERIVVAVGLILMYLRTAEAMVPYSPHSIVGLRGDWIGYLWAYLAAALVEGVLWIGYNKLRTLGKDSNTKWAAATVVLVSFAFSAVMNVVDVRTLNGTLVIASGTPEMDFLVNTIVLVPGIAVAMFMIIEIIDAQFSDGPSFRPKNSRPMNQNRPNITSSPAPMPQIHGKNGNSNGNSNGRGIAVTRALDFDMGDPGPAMGDEDPFLPSKRR